MAHIEGGAQGVLHALGDGVGLVDVVHHDLDAGEEAVGQAEDVARGLEVHEGQGGIVFEHAGLEDAHHLEGADARRIAGGTLFPGGGEQVDAAAQADAQTLGQLLADDDARRALAFQIGHGAATDLAQHAQDLGRAFGIDAAQHQAFDAAGGGEHDFRIDEGRGAAHMLHGLHAPHQVGVLLEGRGHVRHDDAVGIGADDLVTHVGGQAVVDAQDHHQGADAEGDAQDGHDGDDVDEGLFAA